MTSYSTLNIMSYQVEFEIAVLVSIGVLMVVNVHHLQQAIERPVIVSTIEYSGLHMSVEPTSELPRH